MASLFWSVLCCFGKRHRAEFGPDETSRLLPTAEDEYSPGHLIGRSSSSALDRALFKERLGNIVRSKEGYMVNVSSPLPFNLHNKPRALLDATHGGSFLTASSRSASASTFPDSQSSIHPHSSRVRPPVRVRSNLATTPLVAAGRSISRTASQSSLSSITSSQKNEAPEEKIEVQPGILGVRLIHGIDLGYRLPAHRGRSRVKQDDGEDIDSSCPNVPDLIEGAGDPKDHRAEYVDSTQNDSNEGYPRVSISPASDRFEFRLHEVGALSVSWGD